MRNLPVASTRLFARAFAADPALAEDAIALRAVRDVDDAALSSPRYIAACAAALAGVGHGADAPPPDADARAGRRAQALGWLRADLTAWSRALGDETPEARALVQRWMTHWKRDADLAGVRDPRALSGLPDEERDAWRALWGDVDALLKAARGH
jgi:serine/threonine-protein kinase